MRYDNILPLSRGRLRSCPKCRQTIDHIIVSVYARIQLMFDGHRIYFVEISEADSDSMRVFCPRCHMLLEISEVMV